ncbi:MAG TPA: ATP-dependent zinc metalloprotease FtsH [Chloroflexota bacterium]|nr:ATP-dependent zinc metalloprotease FtsH [Chloroflexota bacterium]
MRDLPRKFIFLGAVAFFLLCVGVAILVRRDATPGPTTVPVSELLNLADQHRIDQVVITNNTLLATAKDGQQYRAVKEDQQPVTQELRADGVTVSVVDANSQGLGTNALAAIFPLLAIFAVIWLMSRKGGINNQAMSFGRSGARRYAGTARRITFDDVAGVEEAKQELAEIVQFLKFPEKFRAIGARVPKGVLLVGPPGTGKTLISRALAGEAEVPFFSISGSEFVEMFVGVGASRVRDLFAQAKRSAPGIIFIDEIDAVGRHRGNNVGGHDEREQTLNQLLVEMDGFDASTNLIVIAATNRPDVLDPALLRPGRFDRRVILDPPDINGRRAILEVHARNKRLEPGVDLAAIAQQTSGLSGADLANVLNEAAILAARFDKELIGRDEIEEGIMRVLAGPERKSRVVTDYEKSIVAYHEVGHALVMKALKHANPVTKVSIISRGQALGVTVQAPREDSYLTSKAQLTARMAALLGGRAAEELIFGDVTTGARQDLEVVTDIARRMVLEFGMSDLGVIATPKGDPNGSSLSPDVANQVDLEAKRLIDEAFDTARAILNERREKVVEVAEYLKQVETINGEQLETLLGPEWIIHQTPIVSLS